VVQVAAGLSVPQFKQVRLAQAGKDSLAVTLAATLTITELAVAEVLVLLAATVVAELLVTAEQD
jgi:hypothetical protein